MERKVAVYVQGRYAKPAYKVESYDTRAWPGLELVCHALRQAGIEVEYCSAATVDRYKVVLDALVLRGTEDDSEIIGRLASNSKFRNGSTRHRHAILERYVDIDRLFRAYTWEDLPTRYLASHTPAGKLRNMDDLARQRAGDPWSRDCGNGLSESGRR